MSSGAFLKERKRAETPVSSQRRGDGAQRARNRRRRRRRNRQRTMLITLIVILAGILGAMLLWLNSNPLEGTWYMDEVTAYEFGPGGKGKMVLPTSEYEFSYKVKQDTLSIDFVYEGAKDAEYSFEISDDVLTLNGGNDTTKGEFILTKGE